MFIGFLEHVERLSNVVARRRFSYGLLKAEPGAFVADVGSGLGTAARELHALGVRVHGFDAGQGMVAQARQRAAGLSIEFTVAADNAVPLQDAALDGYRAERLYQHLADPGSALVEARRVLGPGGRIVLIDQDWDAFVIDGEPREVTGSVLRAFSDSIRNGLDRRSYHRLLVDAGFVDLAVHPETVAITGPHLGQVLPNLMADAAVASGTVDAGAAARWVDDQRARLAAGRFFAAMTHFVALASRPR